jgi:hypothetical protein
VIDAVEWDADDPNTLRAAIRGDGRSVYFRVNQRSEVGLYELNPVYP